MSLNEDFNFSLSHDHEEKVLALEIEKGITDVSALQKLHAGFVQVLGKVQ